MAGGMSVQEQPHVRVSGVGVVFERPDVAYLQAGVTVQQPLLEAALGEAAGRMQAVMEQLRAAGVEEADVSTQQYRIETVMSYLPDREPALAGFRVVNMLSAKLRDLERVGEVIDSVVRAGANTVGGLSFGFSDPQALVRAAREAAVQDAQGKAGQLAELAGVKLGPPLSIEESGSEASFRVAQKSARVLAASADGPTPVSPGEGQVRVQVEVVFGLG